MLKDKKIVKYLLIIIVVTFINMGKVGATPVNSAFTDDNFYKCVVDAYNDGKQLSDRVGYSTSLTDQQLKSVTFIQCDYSVSNLNGMEKLENLSVLRLPEGDNISAINTSNNLALTQLSIYTKNLTTLNISQSTGLKVLNVGTYNCNLGRRGCGGTLPSTINLSQNPELTEVNLGGSGLTSINLSNNTDMEKLSISNNDTLSSIDLSHNENLNKLILVGIMANLNLSNNTNINYLSVFSDNLTNLNVSNLTLLKELHIQNRKISSLNISQNSNLEVLDIPMVRYEYDELSSLTNIDLTNNANLKKVSIDSLQSSIDISHNEDLELLSIKSPNLTSVDISHNGSLKSFSVYGEKFEQLIGNANTNQALEELYLYSDKIINLNTSIYSNLKELDVESSNLTSIDISQNSKLESIEIESPKLTSFTSSVIANSELKEIELVTAKLPNLDVSNYPKLTSLFVKSGVLGNIDLSNNIQLQRLSISGTGGTTYINNGQSSLPTYDPSNPFNNMASLNLSNNVNLESLSVSWTKLSTLNLDNNIKLNYLDLEHNDYLNTVDVSKNVNLSNLNVLSYAQNTVIITGMETRYGADNKYIVDLKQLKFFKEYKLDTDKYPYNSADKTIVFDNSNVKSIEYDVDDDFSGKYNQLTKHSVINFVGPGIEAQEKECIGIFSCSIETPSISRSGYEGLGYSTAENSHESQFPAERNTDVEIGTLYTVTRKKLNVSYVTTNPDLTISKESDSCYIYNNENSCTVTLPTITGEDYNILGFSKTDNNQNIVEGDTVTLTDDNTTYYARAVKNGEEPPVEEHTYTATFMYNGTASKTLSCTTTGTSCNVTAPNQEVTDGVFKGWSETSTGAVQYNVGATITLTGNKTFYAVVETSTEPPVEEHTYTATFIYNESSKALSCTTAGTSCTVTAPNQEVTDGVFKGWSETSGGTVRYNVGDTIILSSNKTYYAVVRDIIISENNVTISNTQYSYTGNSIIPIVKVKIGNILLTKDKDYRVLYTNNTNAGTATVTIIGIGNYTGTVEKTYVIQPVSINKFNVEITGIVNKVYTGRNITQNLTVKYDDKLITYNVQYKNNKNVGLAVIYITGKGNYTGTITKTFKIVPTRPIIKSVKSINKKTMTLKLSSKTSNIRYQIAYKKKGTNTWKYAYSTNNYKVIKNLQSKKVYLIKIRAQKQVMNNIYNSSWTSIKSIRVK